MKFSHATIPIEVLLLGGLTLLIHLATNGNYGYFRDELYFISCGKRLAWGYVDQPPLAPIIAYISNMVSGGSLTIFRIPAALSHALAVTLTGYMALQIGGNRLASIFAAIATLISPLLLVNGHLMTMNSFEPLLWIIITILTVKTLPHPTLSGAIALGIFVGLAVMNKHSSVLFAICLCVGILVSNYRSFVFSRWMSIVLAISLLIVVPHLVWQISHQFPMLELLKNSQTGKNVEFHFLNFLLAQVKEIHPLSFLIAFIGIMALLFNKSLVRYRFIGSTFCLFFVLMVFLKAKPYYMAPIYPLLFAAGGFSLESVLRGRLITTAIIFVILVASGLVLAPLAIPILPIQKLISYQEILGVSPQRTENKRYNSLPQHIADQFGWQEIVEGTAKIYGKLPEEEKEKTAIFGSNYGEASALDFFGKKLGLPSPISTHNNYFLWGAPRDLDQWIAVGGRKETYERYFVFVQEVGRTTQNEFAMPYESGVSMYLLKLPREPIELLWPKLKNYN